MTTSPKVTVFIPVYNRERYVGDAIESMLAQSFSDFELLVVDDGSTDDSVAVIESYRDPRVRLVRNEQNLGIPRTRNRGLELARGEYIAILDSDDCSYPDRLEKQLAFLDAHPDYAEVGSWGRAMDDQGRPLKRIKRQPVSWQEVKANLLFRCCISNRSVMGRTALLRDLGYRNDYFRCQDYDMHVRLARHHKVGNLPEVLVLGRIHDQQVTGQTFELGMAKKREIAAGQLAELGVTCTAADLERHTALGRMGKLGFTPDREYLEWAEAWLRKLQQANRGTAVYPEPVFSQVLGDLWLKACRRTASSAGWTVWKRFWQSPLRGGTTGRLRRRLAGARYPA